jgi:hypothetical protein
VPMSVSAPLAGTHLLPTTAPAGSALLRCWEPRRGFSPAGASKSSNDMLCNSYVMSSDGGEQKHTITRRKASPQPNTQIWQVQQQQSIKDQHRNHVCNTQL